MGKEELYAPNKPEDDEIRQLRLWLHLFSIGVASGALMNAQSAIWYKTAQETLARENERQQPPKPPRRPNAGLGRVALGEGF